MPVVPLGRMQKIRLNTKGLALDYIAMFDESGNFEFSAVQDLYMSKVMFNAHEVKNLLGAIADTSPELFEEFFEDRYSRKISDYT